MRSSRCDAWASGFRTRSRRRRRCQDPGSARRSTTIPTDTHSIDEDPAMTRCTGFAAHEAHAELKPWRFERRALREDDVAIAIAYCGVCHSDAHYVHNDWKST